MTAPSATARPVQSEGRDDFLRAGFVFGFAILLAVGYIAVNKWSLAIATPAPMVHDEFAYLLGADTYAHGRLTNPAHPMWRFFESFHILQQPTYASKFPPGASLAITVGQLLGSPIFGVWLAYALACALLTWAARPFVGRTWALAGGLGAALWFSGSYWAYSYWGGALACALGALLLGTVRRLWDQPNIWLGLGLGLALAGLANTRPFEGVLVSGPLVLALLWHWWNAPSELKPALTRAAVPAIVVLVAAFAAMLALNAAVTGSPFVMAYSVYQKEYGWSPLFVFGTPQPRPEARYHELFNFQGWEYGAYDAQKTLAGFRSSLAGKFGILREFYFPVGLWLPFLGLPLIWRENRWARNLAMLVTVSVAAIMLTVWMQPHYAAPFVAPMLVVYLACAQRLAAIGTGRLATGRLLSLLLGGAWLWMGMDWYTTALAMSDPYLRPTWVKVRWEVLDWLGREPGQHVVIVRYGRRHNIHDEWVYNGADIDGSKVLFARDLGAAENAKLVAHFAGRKVWVALIDGRRQPIRVGPYRGD